MTSSYSKLKVLIVDDFNSFRMSLSKIMYEMGFRNVESVGSGEEAISLCRKNHFDIILADYNLGKGKNGQQLLEELRSRKLRLENDLFILLSAETSRNVVMSAFDCQPDGYLTKPITTKVIQQRLKRLLGKRMDMMEVNSAIEKGELEFAIYSLENKLKEKTRYGADCQKKLADLYIQTNQLDKAETLYRTVLEIRALDWAQVGLANVKIKKGDPEKAVNWLSQIISDNPSCMQAYDVMTDALSSLNKNEELQENLEKAVSVSPMSLGRQTILANVALANGDTDVAVNAYRKTLRQGSSSSHNTIDNQMGFVKSVVQLYDKDAAKADQLSKEAEKIASMIAIANDASSSEKLSSKLMTSQIKGLSGNIGKSQQLLEEALLEIPHEGSPGIDVEIEVVNALRACNKTEEAQKKIKELLAIYAGDEAALEKLDYLLNEPVSIKGKKHLSETNKNGINAYKAKEYDHALMFFSRLEKRYPRYIGVKLNLVQTLIGAIKDLEGHEENEQRCKSILDTISRMMKPDNPQYKRFLQLSEMLRSLIK